MSLRRSTDLEEHRVLEQALEESRRRGLARTWETLGALARAAAVVVVPDALKAKVAELLAPGPGGVYVLAFVPPQPPYLRVGAWHALAVNVGPRAGVAVLIVRDRDELAAVEKGLQLYQGALSTSTSPVLQRLRGGALSGADEE